MTLFIKTTNLDKLTDVKKPHVTKQLSSDHTAADAEGTVCLIQ